MRCCWPHFVNVRTGVQFVFVFHSRSVIEKAQALLSLAPILHLFCYCFLVIYFYIFRINSRGKPKKYLVHLYFQFQAKKKLLNNQYFSFRQIYILQIEAFVEFNASYFISKEKSLFFCLKKKNILKFSNKHFLVDTKMQTIAFLSLTVTLLCSFVMANPVSQYAIPSPAADVSTFNIFILNS